MAEKVKKIEKIMLISPPVTRPKDFSAKVVRVSPFFPLGIAYVAAAVEKLGQYELSILDALIKGEPEKEKIIDENTLRYGLTNDEILHEIKAFKPDLVGVSCLFAAMEEDAANICRVAKKVDTTIVTVVGGAHAGGGAERFLENHSAADFVVIGEGEVTIVNLLRHLESSENLREVDGLAYRQGEKIVVQPKKQFIEHLDSIPFPARHLFNMNDYFVRTKAHSVHRRVPFSQMITSRGCPLKCAFCALGNHWGPRSRFRGVENVLDEIEILVNEYGVKEIHFEDDNLTADKERALGIFNGIIERKLDIVWNVPSGMAVYSLDEEIIEKMSESGCYSISLAIESGDPDVLKNLMNKPVDLKKIPRLVSAIRKTGMDARGFFILGYPGETKETMRRTIDFAKSCELDWAYFFIASPLPNTKMWKQCVEKGYIRVEDFDPIRSFHRSIITTPDFDPEFLAEIREEAIIDVNFRNNPNLLKYNIDKAIENFQDVVDKYPHFDFAQHHLGLALLKKGERDKAKIAFQNALKANPNHQEAKHQLAIL